MGIGIGLVVGQTLKVSKTFRVFEPGDRTDPKGLRDRFTLAQVRASDATRIEVVGHAGRTLEYRDAVDPAPRWHQDEHGLHISIMSAHRLYNMWDWPNPLVVKISPPAA